MSLVNHLTSTLLKHEPNDPVEFLVNQVEDMIQFRDHSGKPPILFSDDDLTNVFKGVDYLNSGTIDLSEYFRGEVKQLTGYFTLWRVKSLFVLSSIDMSIEKSVSGQDSCD